MGTGIQIWSTAKTLATGAVIGLTISDRYLTIVTTKGDSMHPTLTAADSFFRGCSNQVMSCSRSEAASTSTNSPGVMSLSSSECPSDHKKDFVKRLIALPGEWIRIPVSQKIIKVPAGHCWVEGDNADRSWDSRSFGPIPLGLIKGRVTHIIWPPSKMGRVERKWPEGRVSPF
ncbi:mitochondrial inner membrane protease subunit 2-like [Lolium rigidum]|uniref:mitochondrial inner membrane protease subunit 2-like n=1 Tax=Lolium rigidum TaxID=89674 RepID=UPI001F5DB5F1|nr:mitochondrial inner membrane protease subunit 2-like [Lolium rigidum]